MNFPETFKEVEFVADLGGWTLRAKEMPRGWLRRSSWRWCLTGPNDEPWYFNCGFDLAVARLWASAHGGRAHAGGWGHDPLIQFGGACVDAHEHPRAREWAERPRLDAARLP